MVFNFFSEREKGQSGYFETLQPDRNPNDGDTP